MLYGEGVQVPGYSPVELAFVCTGTAVCFDRESQRRILDFGIDLQITSDEESRQVDEIRIALNHTQSHRVSQATFDDIP